MNNLLARTLGLTCALSNIAFGIDSKSSPRPIPLTRPEMKQFLEDMKSRKPRIPLPELSAEDQEKLGERATSYESRIRFHYLPATDPRGGITPAPARGPGGGGGGRDNDPEMTLSYKFKVQLFWIVSRTNNCQYCLGHQESKLLAAGMVEDEIASLDSDWSSFTPAEQAAFAFARKFTYEPHRFNNKDIDQLRKHFTDMQIIEMILSMAGNNSINRWKEGAGIPQSPNGGGFGRRPEPGQPAAVGASSPTIQVPETYLTPTADRFKTQVTSVAPLVLDPGTRKPTGQTVYDRPALESRDQVERELMAARKRTPRLPLVDDARAREFVTEDGTSAPLPQWVRLIANFPTSAKTRIAGIRATEEKGDLSLLLKAQVSWIIACQDRAWYAAGLAQQRLRELGQSDEQIDQLNGDWKQFTPKDRSLFTVARQLAAAPVVLTDDEVAAAVALAGPRDVVQLINYVTHRASFDRITESAGLSLPE